MFGDSVVWFRVQGLKRAAFGPIEGQQACEDHAQRFRVSGFRVQGFRVWGFTVEGQQVGKNHRRGGNCKEEKGNDGSHGIRLVRFD